MWLSLSRWHARRRRPGRFWGSAAVSLVLHALAALLLSFYVVQQRSPEVVGPAEPLELVVWTGLVLPEERPKPPEPEPPPAEPEPLEPVSEPVLRPPRPPVATTDVREVPRRWTPRESVLNPPVRPPEPRGAPRPDPLPTADAPSAPAPHRRVSMARVADRPVAYVPSGEVIPVDLPTGRLRVESPRVHRGRTFFEAPRGLGFGNAPGGSGYNLGTSYGNGSGLSGLSNGSFRELMIRLARGVVSGTEAKKIDAVFLVDRTASMEDNVRGILAYCDEFVNVLTYAGREVRFGLVAFSDYPGEPLQVKGMTDRSGQFRNWLRRIEFTGGGPLAESGLDALMEALQRLKFRDDAVVRFFLFSDAPFHDRDYDGQSPYTLDEVLAVLHAKRIRVDVVGLDYLPVQQLAYGTGGRWYRIPGRGYLEQISMPLPVRGIGGLGALAFRPEGPVDEVFVFVDPHRPAQWVELRWRVLGPRGHRLQGEFVERMEVPDGATRVVFRPHLRPEWFQAGGLYTVIYRLADSNGKSVALRRVLEYR